MVVVVVLYAHDLVRILFVMEVFVSKYSEKSEEEKKISSAPLGKSSSYITQYTNGLLFPIPRRRKRDEIGVPEILPFSGYDTWNAYEVSWLNAKGKPVVAIVQFDIPCTSINIVESKSFKLYLNSFNNTKFNSSLDVESTLKKDIGDIVGADVLVKLFKLDNFIGQEIKGFFGECLDERDVSFDDYVVKPEYLLTDSDEIIEECVFSNLLKSNCLVTGQPDWGSVRIEYRGMALNKSGLLRYIVSFRDHNEFHEQCVERIFMDIMKHCKPEKLTVEARYTRRGGLDINPVRSTESISPSANIRMSRQ